MVVPLNNNIEKLQLSSTLAINEKSKQLEKEGLKIFRLGLGQSPFPIPNCVVDSLKSHASEKNYLPVNGLYELRKNISEFNKRFINLNSSPEDVIVGPGLKELMFNAQLAFKGPTLLPSPCWVSYGPQAKIIKKPINLIKTSFDQKFKITPENLKKHSDKKKYKLLILNYPNNPTGLTYTKKELKSIAEIARENNIIVISDEIYGMLDFSDNHVSLAKYYPEGTIVSSGLSKWCGAGGWRFGYMIFPKELENMRKAMVNIASETYTTVNAPVQYAAIKAFSKNKEIDDYLFHCRKILKILSQESVKILENTKLKFHKPEGGFYIFPDFTNYSKTFSKKGIKNSKDLCKIMLNETGVATLPGSDFERPNKELSIRMAFVNFDGSLALKKSYEMGKNAKLDINFLKKYCPDTIEAFKRIVEWLPDKA